MPEKITALVGDKQILIETGKLAKQADGAVTIQLGETIVVVAAVAAINAKENQEFFPSRSITVRKPPPPAASGRLLQARRPADRKRNSHLPPHRPADPPALSQGLVQRGPSPEHRPERRRPERLGHSEHRRGLLRPHAQRHPLGRPLGAVRLARVAGQFIANPTHTEREQSDLDLVYVGSEKELVMYEGSANEIPEADFVEALRFAQTAIQPLIQAQKELVARVGKPKRAIKRLVIPDEVLAEAKSLAGARIVPALLTSGKLAREAAVRALFEEIAASSRKSSPTPSSPPACCANSTTRPRRRPSAASSWTTASASTAAILTRSAPSTAKSAFCPGPTARRSSRAARPRP